MKRRSKRCWQIWKRPAIRSAKIKRGERRRKPSAPFITSTLQQEASRRLGYTARRTMALAQQLYEGMDVGEGGATGLITYMRTDSTNISDLAINEVREFIKATYGDDFLPPAPPSIRPARSAPRKPTKPSGPPRCCATPEKVKSFLSSDQFKLYQLIWQRFVACQMEAAIYDTLSVEVTSRRETA